MPRVLLVGILCLFGLSPSAHAQEQKQRTSTGSRPKIGVALEGGGALGLAHIGVLRWLEQHKIPIDYIAGTSMGGLVGGLYAAGRTPEQLQALVDAQNWDIILGGQTPYEDLSFRRKEDLRLVQNSLTLGLKNGLSLPSGLNAGSGISLLIDRETLAYSELNSFDDLPIPFRCVATDLISGKEEVFSKGSLQRSLRATMSIPGVFSPVRSGQKVYVDGGLVGNLPTHVVREMGADVVIAVHLQVAPADPDQIRSLFSVLGRSVDVVIHENEIRGLAGADLVVNADVHAFDSMDYGRAREIIEVGVQAAQAKERILLPYAIPDAEWAKYVEEKRERQRLTVPVPQFVKVEGTDGYTARRVEAFLRPLVGEPIKNEKIDELLTRLTGTGKFDTASYQIATENGEKGLLVTVHELDYAPPMLQLGFSIDGSESDDVTFTQLARITFLDVAGYRSQWRTDLQFGNTYGIASELYRPLTGTSRWFVSPRADASDASFKIFEKSSPLAIYRFYREDIGADLGYAVSRFTEIRAGYEVGHFNADLRLGRPEFASVEGRLGDTRVHVVADHRDDFLTPRRGYSVEGTFRWYDTSPYAFGGFPVMQARTEFFVPVGKPASIFVVAEGGTTFGSTNIGVPQFFLGGVSHLSAYGTNELFGNQYYYGRAGYLRRVLALPPFVGRDVYAIGAYELGKMYGAVNSSKFPNDGAVGLLANTALGPFFFGASVGDTGHAKWFFELGHVF
jgi:NTE family protein